MEQINKMAFTVADLQSVLDVYKGLFLNEDDAKIIFSQFPEIAKALKNSLSTNLIISCAALFTDPAETPIAKVKYENMCFENLYKKYGCKFSSDTVDLKSQIQDLISSMNLKTFRNKYVGHYGLNEILGKNFIARNITTVNIETLLNKSQIMLNMIIRDAKLLPSGESLGYYSSILDSRSPKSFLDILKSAKKSTQRVGVISEA
jgi:hypothetical protein